MNGPNRDNQQNKQTTKINNKKNTHTQNESQTIAIYLGGNVNKTKEKKGKLQILVSGEESK